MISNQMIQIYGSSASSSAPKRMHQQRAPLPEQTRPAKIGAARSFGKFPARFRSFSAVSAAIFASKYMYAFWSIFQNLPDYPAEIFEIRQIFADFATLQKFC